MNYSIALLLAPRVRILASSWSLVDIGLLLLGHVAVRIDLCVGGILPVCVVDMVACDTQTCIVVQGVASTACSPLLRAAFAAETPSSYRLASMRMISLRPLGLRCVFSLSASSSLLVFSLLLRS